MRKKVRSYEMDMTSGKILPKVLMYTFPLILTSMLQLLYNAADVIVVGRFSGSDALAAVGSTGALINLIINIFLGLSIGTNVIVAKYYGAGDYKNTFDTVHTSITVSLIGGVLLAVFGVLFGGVFLNWMGSPKGVLPLATVYIKIYFAGMPFNMLYNFGAAVLRAVGDTKRPLYFLMFSGIINVLLNLVFVICFKMGVAGVALATIISQMISAILVVLCMIRSEGFIHLNLKKLHVSKNKLLAITRVGLPAGFQGACFSISNVLIQSTINSFGATIVAGNSASSNIEGFVYVAMNAFHQASITFTSTNIGAQKNSRIQGTMKACLLSVCAVGIGMGLIAMPFARILSSVYSSDAAVIDAAVLRLQIFLATYFLCGVMDMVCGMIRGMGYAIVPMIVSILGACAFRIFWIYCILPAYEGMMKLRMLYYSYPISWILTGAAHFVCYFILLKKFPSEKKYISVSSVE